MTNKKDNRYEIEGKGMILFMLGMICALMISSIQLGNWRWLGLVFIGFAFTIDFITKEKEY